MRTTRSGGRRVSGLASATAALAPFAQQVKHVDGQEPALPAISDRARGHQEPALQQAASLDEQFGVGAVRQVLV